MACLRDYDFYDQHLGSGPHEDDEICLFQSDSDSESLQSDDSVLPDYGEEGKIQTANTLYEACSENNVPALKRILEGGVTRDEVMELDINGRNGLMVASYKGYQEIVYELQNYQHLDINHQDNDGNTALMIAAQAGHVSICNYILNYFPGVDTEVRDCRGFTALIKAAMQGRSDAVAALVMHGADLNAVDLYHGNCAQDWALKTGRFDTLRCMHRLRLRPTAKQFCLTYIPEWPDLKVLVAKATASKSTRQKVVYSLQSRFGFSFPRDPQDNGVMDHMVRMTSCLRSPLIATATHPLCPSSPPRVGKRRLAVAELRLVYSDEDLEGSSTCHSSNSVFSGSQLSDSVESVVMACCANTKRRGSVMSFIPRSLSTRPTNICTSSCVPQIHVTKSAEPTPKKERKMKTHKGYLEPPKWKYKETRIEKRKERKKAEKEKGEKEKLDKRKRK